MKWKAFVPCDDFSEVLGVCGKQMWFQLDKDEFGASFWQNCLDLESFHKQGVFLLDPLAEIAEPNAPSPTKEKIKSTASVCSIM